MGKQELYSELYKLGQQVLQDNNPCKVSCGKCLRGSFCCDGCEHLGPNGCTVEALSCKLWLCADAANTPDGKRAGRQLRVLRLIAWEHNVRIYCRASKEETFGLEGQP